MLPFNDFEDIPISNLVVSNRTPIIDRSSFKYYGVDQDVKFKSCKSELQIYSELLDKLAINGRVTSDDIREVLGLSLLDCFNIRPGNSGRYFDHDRRVPFPYPARMWVNGPYTTIEWDDGTKTTVKCEDDANASDFGGFCAAFTKKMFSSTSNVIHWMKKAKEAVQRPAKIKADIRAKEKAQKQAAHQKRIEEREAKIEAEMERRRIEKMAAERMMKNGEVDV